MMIIFAYLPYGLAEGISLSGKRWRRWTAGVGGLLSSLEKQLLSLGSLSVVRHDSGELEQ